MHLAFTTYKLRFKISDGWEFVKLRGEKPFHIYLLVYSAYIFWFATDFSKARQILVWVGKTCNMKKKWQKGLMILSWLRLGLRVILHKHVKRCLELGLKLNHFNRHIEWRRPKKINCPSWLSNSNMRFKRSILLHICVGGCRMHQQLRKNKRWIENIIFVLDLFIRLSSKFKKNFELRNNITRRLPISHPMQSNVRMWQASAYLNNIPLETKCP